jgi:P4 family phage/plasmid primase-like protien
MNSNQWADFWRNDVGVNVIPALNKTKIPKTTWKEWQETPIPLEIHNQWKKQNLFDEGLAIICGQVFHNEQFKGMWVNAIDCDNQAGLEAMCPTSVEHTAQGTLVEQHANPNKCHVLFYSDEPLKNRAINPELEYQIEVKSMGKHLLYCSGGYHKDGSLIDIVGTKKIKIVDKNSLEKTLDSFLGTITTSTIVKESTLSNLNEGDNRQINILSKLGIYFASIPKEEITEQDCIHKALGLNAELGTPYDETRAVALGKDFFNMRMTDDEENETEEEVTNKGIMVYTLAKKLMEQYDFITLEGFRIKEILFYSNGIYRKGGEEIISQKSRKITNGVFDRDIKEIKSIIRDETGYYSHDDFDKDPAIINTKSGLLNLKTGIETTHDSKYLSRVQIPIKYDSEAKCPQFDKFLSSSLDNDERKIRTVLEMMALCLIKDNSMIQKAFMHTGKGSNGKSVLFGILYNLLGKSKNISSKTIHAFENSNFATSALENKLANICADVGNKGIKETEELKKIIGGDPIDCEPKFKDSYSFTPYSTLIFSANDIPTVNDQSDGFARRFELIEWTKSFYGKNKDHAVNDIKNSKSELSGILNKLIPIAKELLETRSLRYESTVEDAKIAWLRKSDSSKRYIDEKTVTGAEYHEPVALIFSEYNKFAKANGMTPVGDREFNKKLESMGFERKQKKISGSNILSWMGFTLRTRLQIDKQSTFS